MGKGSIANRSRRLEGNFRRPQRHIRRRRRHHSFLHGTAGGHGYRKIRPRRPQNRRHTGLHRHAGIFRPSCRSRPWRFGHDCGRRCRTGHFQFGRKRRNFRHPAGIKTQKHLPDLHYRASRIHHGAACRHPPDRRRIAGGLPARPRPHFQHHRRHGLGRRTRHHPASRTLLYPRRLRPQPSRRTAGQAFAAARGRPDA